MTSDVQHEAEVRAVEASLDRNRQRLRNAVSDLGGWAQHQLSPRAHIVTHRYAWLTAAFVIGWWAGGRGRRS
jgi:hypothetical protein